MSAKKPKRYFLIQWIEQDISWDVVAEEKIRFSHQDDKAKDDLLGVVVDVDWQDETTLAKILRVSDMYRRPRLILTLCLLNIVSV